MMNRNIDILNIKKIYAHQLFNKDILLMKKESKDRHHFSFGEYYDEILLSGYPIEIQSYMLPIHQIIVFSLITKSPVNYTMNIQEAKAIRLADYLQSLGYSPVKQQGNSLWYKSPFREESEPSFKVNTGLNQWFDFGLGKGGNILALVRELYQEDFSKPKIVWAELARTGNAFALDFGNNMVGNTGYILTVPSNNQDELLYLLAFLNSRSMLYSLNQITTRFDENGWRWLRQFVEQLRVPPLINKNEILSIVATVTKDNKQEVSEILNNVIADIYNFTDEEKAYINQTLSNY